MIQNTEGAYYLGELEKSDLHAVMKDADIVLNTSISEGLSNALLEVRFYCFLFFFPRKLNFSFFSFTNFISFRH